MVQQTIIIASDHAGHDLKNDIKFYLKDIGYSVVDVGAFSKSSCDYTDYAYALVEKMRDDDNSLGIAICTTGIGMSIALNRYSFIRAALCTSETEAELARQHNFANVLAIGSGIVGKNVAKNIVDMFLSAKEDKDNERHARRVNKLSHPPQ